MEAAKLAQCDEFIKALPQGYHTLIGENGEKLSGGERQRISIARAILKDAPIILLDEATASLDAENESKIQRALSELIKEKTVLIIAHRMRTVLGADKIIVLKDGQIVETGTPEELQKEQGLFATMLKKQKEA
jgi:ATP-binding cassette subfamily B protein